MFEEKPEITEAVEKLQAAFGNLERGSVIQWADLEEIAGDHTTCPGLTAINKWRAWMRTEKRVVVDAINGVGLRFMPHRTVASLVPVKRQRKARRQCNMALREVATVDGAALVKHERLLLSAQHGHLRQNRLRLGQAYRELVNATTPTESNPRRKLPED